jgi:hypothetical protein
MPATSNTTLPFAKKWVLRKTTTYWLLRCTRTAKIGTPIATEIAICVHVGQVPIAVISPLHEGPGCKYLETGSSQGAASAMSEVTRITQIAERDRAKRRNLL